MERRGRMGRHAQEQDILEAVLDGLLHPGLISLPGPLTLEC
jgi:hypothetical protein